MLTLLKNALTTRKINKALGIKLTKQQKQYIFQKDKDYKSIGSFISHKNRQTGRMTAYHIRLAINSKWVSKEATKIFNDLIDQRGNNSMNKYQKIEFMIRNQ